MQELRDHKGNEGPRGVMQERRDAGMQELRDHKGMRDREE